MFFLRPQFIPVCLSSLGLRRLGTASLHMDAFPTSSLALFPALSLALFHQILPVDQLVLLVPQLICRVILLILCMIIIMIGSILIVRIALRILWMKIIM